MQERAQGLTISQWRRHCSKPYTAPDRMLCLKINNDVVSFHPWAVIDKVHYLPYKMKCNIKHSQYQYSTHYTSFYGCVKYTLHCTRKRVSSAPCLGGRVRDSLPATYTLRIFLWSPEDVSEAKIACWVIDTFEEYEPIYQSITVSPNCLMQTWKGS